MTAHVRSPFCAESKWTCKCLDCKLFRTSYRRSARKGWIGKGLEVSEHGDVLTPLVDEVVVWRLVHGIQVPSASQEERRHATWFLLRRPELDMNQIAAMVGVTPKSVQRLAMKITKENYVSPLTKCYWFAA